MPDIIAVPVIIAGVVLTAVFWGFARKMADPLAPRWAFWASLVLACASLGFTVGFAGTHVITKFLS